DFGDPGIFIYHVETGEVEETGYFGSYARPSHDGKSIVFAGKRSKGADRDIMIASLSVKPGLIPVSMKDAVAITEGGGYDGHPAFTEDDKSIVFVSRRAQSLAFPPDEESDTAGTNEVFIMDLDGKNIERLTDGGAVAWHPEIIKTR
ncbi:MAG: TolB family protein, partial [Kordiimonas sp.]